MESVRFVGMDVHKDSIQLAVLTDQRDDREIEFERQIASDPAGVKRVIRRLCREHRVLAGYEAGCMGYHLQRAVQEVGAECVVIAPSSIARAPGDRVKTDRRDAVAIARLLRNGDGERVHVPTTGDEAVRDYLRCREDLRQEARRYRQRLQHCLIRHGHIYRGGRNWTQGYRRWLGELKFAEAVLAETVQIYYRRIQELEEKLGLMDTEMQRIASTAPYAERVAHLRCFRGIDYLTALAFVSEVGDFRRFASAPAFMAFLGLVPTERSSGSRRCQGAITKTGNGHLRRLLVEAAWHYRHSYAPSKALKARREGMPEAVTAHAARAERRLARKFTRSTLVNHKRAQVAVTAVARELAGFIWAVMVGRLEPNEAA